MIITKISLNDQVLAVLRVWRSESMEFRLAAEISSTLERSQTDVLRSLASLYESGSVNRYADGSMMRYRVSPDAQRTAGCCCCCDGKLFDPARPFCESCGPEFDGRI